MAPTTGVARLVDSHHVKLPGYRGERGLRQHLLDIILADYA